MAAAFAFLMALGITVYPVISTAYNEKHESEIHTSYQEKVEQIDDTAIREAKILAVAYNDAIRSGAFVSEAYSKEAILSASENYYQQLDVTGNGVMGYVSIPAIHVNLPIYHGTDAYTLDAGIGHLLGSSLPVGGNGTHCVLTAHSGVASKKLFSDLPQLDIGDVFYLEVLNETLAYMIDQIQTVLPHDASYLSIDKEKDYCTLVTCTPFGVNSHRLLVRGTRIAYKEAQVIEEAQQEMSGDTQEVSTWEQEYIKGVVIGVIIAVVIVLAAILLHILQGKRHESK